VSSTRTGRILIPKLQALFFLINFKSFKDDVPTADYIFRLHWRKEKTDRVHTKPAKRQQMVAKKKRNPNANSDVPIGNSWPTEAN
jgi:hypothetical protein